MQLIVDTRDLTGVAQGLSFSNTDPGGFETLSFSLPTDQPFYRGLLVVLYEGVAVAWMGRVSEVTVDSKGEQSITTVSAQGHVAALKDNPYQMIYVDRDVTHWQAPSVQRRISLIGSGFGATNDGQVTPDSTTGAPSLSEVFVGAWVAGQNPISESWYDAGSGALIGSLYYAWKKNNNVDAANVNWSWSARLSSDDLESSIDNSGNLRAAGPGSGTVTASGGGRRFADVQHLFQGAGGVEGSSYEIDWTVLAVIGTHHLPLRGVADFTNAPGFYPSDIVRHAASKGVGIDAGVIQDAVGYLVLQSEYRDGADPWKVISDMVGLTGWHAGVWEPLSILGSRPRLDFVPPPQDATAFVARAACSDVSITQRLDDLYDTALVSYSDAAGIRSFVTVTAPFAPLAEAGLSPRTLPLDAGLSSAAMAKTLGLDALLLSQQTARGAGTVTLPANVGLPGGGFKPAHLLRSGLDRLRILDLPNAGPVTDTDTRRRDTFRISRVSSVAAANGEITTQVELDAGANLLEVLQARLAVATGLAGG